MNAAEICAWLSITPERLERLVVAGLPTRGRGRRRNFDPERVRAWLVASGQGASLDPPAAPPPAAATPPAVFRTIAEIAAHYAVDRRTVQDWRAAGMPGECAGPGRPGRYPQEAIDAWLTRTGRRGAAGAPPPLDKSSWRERRDRADALLAEMELAREQSSLIEADVPGRIMLRHVAEARALLAQLPDQFLARFALPADERRRMHAELVAQIEAVCRSIADALEAWADEAAADRARLAAEITEGIDEPDAAPDLPAAPAPRRAPAAKPGRRGR